MAVNTERAGKLIARLGVLEEKITNLVQEKDELIAEIQSLLGGGSMRTTAPMAGNGKKGKKGSLGDKIVSFLQANPNLSTIELMSKGMKVAPNQIALSLYHLEKAGRAFKQGDNYYPAVAIPASIPAPTLDQRYESGAAE